MDELNKAIQVVLERNGPLHLFPPLAGPDAGKFLKEVENTQKRYSTALQRCLTNEEPPAEEPVKEWTPSDFSGDPYFKTLKDMTKPTLSSLLTAMKGCECNGRHLRSCTWKPYANMEPIFKVEPHMICDEDALCGWILVLSARYTDIALRVHQAQLANAYLEKNNRQ